MVSPEKRDTSITSTSNAESPRFAIFFIGSSPFRFFLLTGLFQGFFFILAQFSKKLNSKHIVFIRNEQLCVCIILNITLSLCLPEILTRFVRILSASGESFEKTVDSVLDKEA